MIFPSGNQMKRSTTILALCLSTIVQDGEDAHYQKNRETLRVEKRQAGPADTLCLKLAPGGGACEILERSTYP